MILRPLFRLAQGVTTNIKQVRNLRPTIKIGRDKFQISIDVHQYDKEEIRIKARPEYVVIEGKQERNTKRGYIVRQFARKFKLPKGCNIQEMKSTLSDEGVLTVTAPRSTCDINLPCETMVPISYSQAKADESLVQTPSKPSVFSECDRLLGDGKKDDSKK